jgi:hypothetical protein
MSMWHSLIVKHSKIVLELMYSISLKYKKENVIFNIKFISFAFISVVHHVN